MLFVYWKLTSCILSIFLGVADSANLEKHSAQQLTRDAEKAHHHDKHSEDVKRHAVETVELEADGDAKPQQQQPETEASATRPLMRSQASEASPGHELQVEPKSAGSLHQHGSNHRQDVQTWQVDASAETHRFSELQREAEEEASRLLNRLHQATSDRVNELMDQKPSERTHELPSDSVIEGMRSHHVLDFTEAQSPPAGLLETGSEYATAGKLDSDAEMIPGMSAADLAYKAMDLLYGTTGIIPEDYPYACICDATGLCERDVMKTTCKGRAGTGNHAVRANGGVAAIIPFVTFAALTCVAL